MQKGLILFGLIAVCLFSACGNGGQTKGTDEEPLEKDTIISAKKPTINFYIENSESMDGYLKGTTEFKQLIISYLSDIKLFEVTDSLNFFYITRADEPISVFRNANLDMISDFAGKFELTTFKEKRGKGWSYTDITAIIKKILRETMSNTISILVSDFIFSPEKSTMNPQEYLFNQQIGIKNTMVTRFEKVPNPAFVVYKLQSEFDGQFFYFDTNAGKEKGKYYKGTRPFYIWIVGDVKNVAELCQKVPETKFKGQNSVEVFSVMAGTKAVNYAVKPHSGNFDLSRNNTKTDIDNLAKDSRTGKVNFSINVDFSNLLLDDAYLTNADNYELSNSNYRIKINPCSPNKHGYTHTLNFVADRVYKGCISIKLEKKKPLPQWVQAANDDDGSQPELGKTYGIKYLIEGVFDGFTLKDPYYTEIKININ